MDADSSTKFIGSLTKFLQSLCNGYVEFQRGVELVGHIYLNIDTGEKVDYVLHEKVSKNDENSVTFVSNSFHAQPQKSEPAKDVPTKPNARDEDSESDDDDIMIVDQSKDAPGSTNAGTVPSRGLHPNQSGSYFQRRNRQHPGQPSATVTSQGSSQENINIGNVKLEQLSSDELLSLSSHVDGGDMQGQEGAGRQRTMSDSTGQMWIKPEPDEDFHGETDTGWSQGGEGHSDSSNSSSNIYPMMMHQNPTAFSSNPGFPRFPSSSQGFRHSRPGTSGAGNLYGSPIPGTSQSMDPAGRFAPSPSEPHQNLSGQPSTKSTARWQRYMQRVRSNPEHTFRHRLQNREKCRRYREKKKLEREYWMWRQCELLATAADDNGEVTGNNPRK